MPSLFKDSVAVLFEECPKIEKKRNDKPSNRHVNEWFENCILAKLKLFSFSAPKNSCVSFRFP